MLVPCDLWLLLVEQFLLHQEVNGEWMVTTAIWALQPIIPSKCNCSTMWWVNQPKICLDLLQTCVTSQQFYRNKLNLPQNLTVLNAGVTRLFSISEEGVWASKGAGCAHNAETPAFLSSRGVRGHRSTQQVWHPKPPAVPRLFLHSLLKPELRCAASLKAAQPSQASVCAQRSKCETDGQTCGTGWQSSTAICYPHNHPIKKKEEQDVMDSAYTPEGAD